MQISDIVSKIYFKTKTDVNQFTAADMLRLINNAYERVASLILQSDGRWQWDDTNQSDLAVATTTITSGQQDYSLATAHLRITGMEIKQQSGSWMKLQPIDQTDISDFNASITQQGVVTGVPQYYDLVGTSIFLYPTPSYTQAASLKVYFQRAPVLFTSGEVTAGTKEPGFNSLYHSLIVDWVAYEYGGALVPPQFSNYMTDIQRKEDAIRKDYGKRDKDDTVRMSMAPTPPYK